MVWLLFLLAGCCGREAPTWLPMDPVFLGGESVTIDLSGFATDDKGVVAFEAESSDTVLAEIQGNRLILTPQPDFLGITEIALTAVDGCDYTAKTTLEVHSGDDTAFNGGDCATTLTYNASTGPDSVAVAGSFNDWATEAMTGVDDGVYTLTLDLPPGAYPYKFVEIDSGAFEDAELWTCDPKAAFIQCDPDYKEPWETDWSQDCTPGGDSCNSLLIVGPCGPPSLEVASVAIDRAQLGIDVEVTARPGAAAIASASATLDGQPLDAWDGERFSVSLSDLSPSRHTLRFTVTDEDGNDSEEAYVPFWLDGREREDAVMYFAFLDRLHNGDPSNDFPTGATGSDYEGGDLAGLIDLLPYLDDLGVTVLWISNAQSNAEGAWGGDCGLTYAGYHAYWPDDPFAVEHRFGDEDLLAALVDAAHDRGMRVVMDWVANHVHSDHPYATEHPEWFNPEQACKDTVDGSMNFDRIPESCWFAPYLPDIDYSQPEPLVQMVDDAMWWATTYELDGFRVDAVKHMPHSVSVNLQSAIEARIEHRGAGGDEDFWTVGETFDSYDRINAYIGEDQLDGQFDFPLYYAVRDSFLRDSTELGTVLDALETSRAAYGGALMSTFLGNHDVLRFITDGSEGWQDVCDNGAIRVAGPPADPWAFDRLRLAWTFLFTQPGVPLIYYGDELGLPGHADPDNRQPLEWHVTDLAGVQSVDDMSARVSADGSAVLTHVSALARARAAHPALSRGGWVEWWREYDLFAYGRSSGSDHALVVLNRGESARVLNNALSFAGLPTDGLYEDALTGETFTAVGDSITVDVPARGSRVLIYGGVR